MMFPPSGKRDKIGQIDAGNAAIGSTQVCIYWLFEALIKGKKIM